MISDIQANTSIVIADSPNMPISNTTSKQEKNLALRVLNTQSNYCNGKNQYTVVNMTALIRGTENGKDSSELADEVFERLDFRNYEEMTNYRIISMLANRPMYATTENDLIHYSINLTIKLEQI